MKLSEPKSYCYFGQAQRGFSLIELMIVISILSLMAMFTLPNLASTDPLKIDLATAEVASAIRFTRNESIRTGIPHGIAIDHDNSDATGKSLTVYQLDISGSPFNVAHILNQPLSKQPYDVTVPDNPFKLTISLRNTTAPFSFTSQASTQHLHFDGAGMPAYYIDGQAGRLLSGSIIIGDDQIQKIITISAINGQVTIL